MHPHSRYETRICIVKCFLLLSIIVLLPSSHLFVLLPGELLSLSLLIELGTEGKYQISLWTSKSRKTKINHGNPLSGFQERLAHCGESIPGFCLLFRHHHSWVQSVSFFVKISLCSFWEFGGPSGVSDGKGATDRERDKNPVFQLGGILSGPSVRVELSLILVG